MPDIHDFHAFTSTSSGSGGGGGGSSNSGCIGALITAAIFLFLIMLGMD